MTTVQHFIKAKEYKNAIKYLENEFDNLVIKPTISDSYAAFQDITKCLSNTSYVYYLMKDYAKSLEVASSALKYNSSWYKIHYRLAKVYEVQGKYEDMCKEYDLMIKLLSEDDKNKKNAYMQDYNNRDVNFMKNWVIRNGGAVHEFINIEYYDVDYRGMAVSNSVKPKVPLIKVPFDCIFSLEDSKITNPYNIIILKNDVKINSVHTYLALELLHAKNKKDSRMAPCIRCLPKYFDNVPINFKVGELEPLRGSYAIIKAFQKIFLLTVEYENILATIPDLPFTFSEFTWARTAIITRVYAITRNGKQDTVMVPFADMANHETPPNTKWSFDERIQQFVVESENHFAPGDALYETYGYKCNYRYFVNYGFTVNNNGHEEVVLNFNLIMKLIADRYIDTLLTNNAYTNVPLHDAFHQEYKKNDIIKKLSEASLVENKAFQIGYVYNDAVVKMMNFIRGSELVYSSENAELLRSKELSVHATIVNTINKTLEIFATTIDNDETLLKTYDFNFNYKNSVVMRMGEKKVLQFWLNFSLNCIELLKSTDKKKIKTFNKKINKLKSNYILLNTFNPYIKILLQMVS